MWPAKQQGGVDDVLAVPISVSDTATSHHLAVKSLVQLNEISQKKGNGRRNRCSSESSRERSPTGFSDDSIHDPDFSPHENDSSSDSDMEEEDEEETVQTLTISPRTSKGLKKADKRQKKKDSLLYEQRAREKTPAARKRSCKRGSAYQKECPICHQLKVNVKTHIIHVHRDITAEQRGVLLQAIPRKPYKRRCCATTDADNAEVSMSHELQFRMCHWLYKLPSPTQLTLVQMLCTHHFVFCLLFLVCVVTLLR